MADTLSIESNTPGIRYPNDYTLIDLTIFTSIDSNIINVPVFWIHLLPR